MKRLLLVIAALLAACSPPPDDPSRTEIAGNFEYDYGSRAIDVSKVPWTKKIFRVAHAKMEHDPDVWARVEELVLSGVPQDIGESRE